MTTLKDKAVDIKGKKYVLVSDRVLFLADNEKGNYSIETSYDFIENAKMFICKAKLTIGERVYTGHAQEIIGDGYINKTSALENCETSAVGRACAMAGIGVLDSIASADEIRKAENRGEQQATPQSNDTPTKWINEADFEAMKSKWKAGDNPQVIITTLRKAKFGVSRKMADLITDYINQL